jgi:hypothetical protein
MLFGGGAGVIGLAQDLYDALDTQANNEAAQNGDEGSRQHILRSSLLVFWVSRPFVVAQGVSPALHLSDQRRQGYL